MTSMVERVAKAMFDDDAKADDLMARLTRASALYGMAELEPLDAQAEFAMHWDLYRDRYMRRARTALETLIIPTEAMIAAGSVEIAPSVAEPAYIAMVTAALSENDG